MKWNRINKFYVHHLGSDVKIEGQPQRWYNLVCFKDLGAMAKKTSKKKSPSKKGPKMEKNENSSSEMVGDSNKSRARLKFLRQIGLGKTANEIKEAVDGLKQIVGKEEYEELIRASIRKQMLHELPEFDKLLTSFKQGWTARFSDCDSTEDFLKVFLDEDDKTVVLIDKKYKDSEKESSFIEASIKSLSSSFSEGYLKAIKVISNNPHHKESASTHDDSKQKQ